jgi:hypothetical protein
MSGCPWARPKKKKAGGDFPVRVRFGRISEDWEILQNQRHAVKLYLS